MNQKLKLGRRSFIDIMKDGHALNYSRWVEFIENHKEYFIWYEETENGISIKDKLDRFSEETRAVILYRLNKTNVYCTKKITKDPSDCVILFNKHKNKISVSLEKKMKKELAAIVLEMAKYLDAKVIVDDKKEFYSLEQLG